MKEISSINPFLFSLEEDRKEETVRERKISEASIQRAMQSLLPDIQEERESDKQEGDDTGEEDTDQESNSDGIGIYI